MSLCTCKRCGSYFANLETAACPGCVTSLEREAAEWKEATDQANAAIEHYQAERNKAERELAEVRADAAAVRELMNIYNLGGWTDAVAPMKRALAAEAALGTISPPSRGDVPREWYDDMRGAWEREKLRADKLERPSQGTAAPGYFTHTHADGSVSWYHRCPKVQREMSTMRGRACEYCGAAEAPQQDSGLASGNVCLWLDRCRAGTYCRVEDRCMGCPQRLFPEQFARDSST